MARGKDIEDEGLFNDSCLERCVLLVMNVFQIITFSLWEEEYLTTFIYLLTPVLSCRIMFNLRSALSNRSPYDDIWSRTSQEELQFSGVIHFSSHRDNSAVRKNTMSTMADMLYDTAVGNSEESCTSSIVEGAESLGSCLDATNDVPTYTREHRSMNVIEEGGRQKLSRKDVRKQEREQKKQRKAEFFSSSHPHHAKRHAEDEHIDSPSRKRARLSEVKESTKQTGQKPSKHKTHHFKPSSQESHEPQRIANKEPHSKPETALEKLARKKSGLDAGGLPKAPQSQQEQQEDAYIRYLESKLGWAKGGARTSKYGKGIEDDGLDDLLADIDSIETSIFSTSKPTIRLEEDDELQKKSGTEGEHSAGGEEEEEEEEKEYAESENEKDADEQEEEEIAEDSDDDHAGDSDEDEWGGIGENSTAAVEKEPPESETSTKAPLSGVAYVPPHMRKSANETQSESQIKLTRQLKGLLNRMSEQNMSTILDSMEEIYRNQRRHDVSSTITTLIIDGISSHSMLLDSYVVLHAAFIATLHKMVGVEFAAHFVQNVVASYERHFLVLQNSAADPAGDEILGKECSNMIVLLSELYNFQVISCSLVYDIIRGLLDGELTEFKVELLLKIVRNSGQQLRVDDPSALKDIVEIVHSKLPANQHEMSSRSRFMVETLTNLKNNKFKKGTAGGQGAHAVERMKKYLSGLSKKRHLMAHEPLRVRLADLHSAETKGKWWLVGAAWGGDPLLDRQDEIRQKSNTQASSAENVLLKLAKKQGMNTDIRRSIFVVLMSSEDYVDACERLSQLKLTEVQQREIIRVLLHCCGNEKSYNPYYAFVAQQLCRTSHSYIVTLQFCLWDFLRDLGESNVGGLAVLKNLKDDVASFEVGKISSTRSRNVARAYAWWLAKDACTLAILKPVDFTDLKPQTHQFFTELFAHLLIDTQLPTPLLNLNPKDFPLSRNRGPLEEVFIKATKVETLALGVAYFLDHTFRQSRGEEDSSGFINWATKVAVETLRTGIDVIAAI
ncbi:hypothetical protein BC835DRAFT_1415230 [Cytidiella melzeri]|nr:hypothetical protein BC835DRAFT_1415230 [Cytidiella melzeri]